ncbi:bifunctional 2-polyprenyl-6-hydroxyphenol methylase/3-demethylubiquinol 3-O-methyltransferase UbiG [Colwellia sp. MB02u-18]|uniref:bifunctional 2-polyprenyl-6-hydroxyphenol methylase/3-demethylubiquinol 3-O-methyltransferase UbiG n=1 Tax=unclassified Colwellia TaxID=196834 RepID=UPI0015F545FA|nr:MULTISPECIES: bifunctional 2-polyprenyl-6-hydroxyphenol methylase/3-demethylubiquinol 3-O-methyltransferase UbiG [unclassified Colwellia]MBA6224875.1 bifunctional 2-polyprenyl-6-hydroxyphenol methylase/3-demethylubiquinol 3-O-methyltransferase UbiG [Colwellia sp. MB3u-45]MBA6268837.1 bifunctional 2-polyprenyl-6-hydroxyphenol methylase/3-demethylubiquinol 3-O-methyltransferase UbiG [Colwellia sp. MB3u-43]MBA6321268.1 bifunctional 2-polyprenyl-6-hydroxyphenol methylase/3-demethylubiquinol 3-O-m
MSNPLNVNPDEIAKFEQVASQWWELDGDFKPLHQINPLRRQFICQHVGDISAKKIIDVGCGGGILAESLAQLGADVTGIDMGQAPLNVAKLHALEAGVSVDYQKITAEEKAQQPQHYDVVTCMEMLEHVPDPESIIKACAQMVKPGGFVFFSTLNKSLKAYLLAIVAAEKILKLVPNGTHDHKSFIRPSTLIAWAESYELKCIDAAGIHYNPLTENHKLNSSLDVNYILCCQRV